MAFFTRVGSYSAIGKPAHQSQTGEHAAQADKSGERFARAMPIIDPFNAGGSYLMYKLMAHPDYVNGPASPGNAEWFRMRKGLVVGMPMPATGVGLSPKGDVAIEAISAWITEGASMTSLCCNSVKDGDETDVDCGGGCGSS